MMGGLRASAIDIEKARAARSTRFLLTGGTGFLGSHIAVGLLRRGFAVRLLARPDGRGAAADRVGGLLDWFGLPAAARGGLKVAEGDITRPDLGLAPDVLCEALRDTDEIIHCASSTSFSERKRAEVETVNTRGLSHVLAFARASNASFFHHLSTAFVAGKAAGPCREEPASPPGFWNVYEETKCRGERLTAEACAGSGLGFTIYRPSIVYGDSRSGRSLLFNGVYYPVRAALFLRDLYEKDLRERGGRRAAEVGVRLEPDGSVHLPLRIAAAGRGGVDLVPVDYLTDAFFALMEGAPEGGIFHIVNGRVKPIEDIIDYSCRLFRMTGVRTAAPKEFEADPRNPLERLYDNYIEAYGPYMRDTRIFETTKSGPILRRRGLVCPEFDYGVFARCMTFAVEAGWGSRLFDPAAPGP
ncbi:MAG TPA: SDR family oxidoreductase [Terriglobales bacterium]|nr:SDR family oxidoreductase [Terriglobales bacterium]